MKLEDYKKQVSDFNKKDALNLDSKKEYSTTQSLLEQVKNLSADLDYPIKEMISETEQEVSEAGHFLEMERSMIESERNSISSDIQTGLDGIQKTLDKVSSVENTMYGDSTKPVKGLCERMQEEYLALLEELGMARKAMESGDTGTARSTLEKCQSEIDIIECKMDAAPALLNISPAVKESVQYYTGDGYIKINESLRGYHLHVDRETKKDIDNIHSLLSSNHTKKAMTVYRGISRGVPMVKSTFKLKKLEKYSNEELVGKLLVDGAFVSTSMKESAAFQKPIMLVINLPKGSPGLYIKDLSVCESDSYTEDEFLLDKNRHFRVTKAENRNNKRYIYVDAII